MPQYVFELMGSSKKSKKRRHRSASGSDEEPPEKKRHHHHHKKHKKHKKRHGNESDASSRDSDVIYQETTEHKEPKRKEKSITPPPPVITIADDSDSEQTVATKAKSETKRHHKPRVPKETKEQSPVGTGKFSDSLSIEETNRLRAKLGLKPLQVGSSGSARRNVEKSDVTDRGDRNDRDRNDRDRNDRERDRNDRDRNDREKNERDRNDRDRNDRKRPRESDHSERPPLKSALKTSNYHSDDFTSKNSGHGDSLSIEESNKLRAKLGLKPLQVDDSHKSGDNAKHKDDLGEFYHKPAANITETKQQQKLRDKLAERKEKRKLEMKLSSLRTLGDSDSDVDDTESWVDRTRRIQKERNEAAKRAQELEELDKQLGIGDLIEEAKKEQRVKAYTAKNLKGLRVEHDLNDVGEEATTILTLKDKEILAEDNEDVLVNVNMLDDERYKRNIEVLKKKVAYKPYDDEFDEDGNPVDKNLLAQYDEKDRKSFLLGQRQEPKKDSAAVKAMINKRIESLQLPELKIASDYFTEDEMVKFKKPKKKVRKIREKGKILKADDLEAITMQSGSIDPLTEVGSRRRRPGEDFLDTDDTEPIHIKPDEFKVDDDDHLTTLSLQKAKKLKNKQPKNLAPPIERIKEEPMDTSTPSTTGGQFFDDGNIILNSTAEFCRTLGDIPTYGRAGNREEDENEMMDFEKEMNEFNQPRAIVNDDENVPTAGKWNAVDTQKDLNTRASDLMATQETPILDAEPDVGSGVAEALRLAASKGYLEKEVTNRPSTSRLAHLQAKHYSIEDKTYEGDDKFGGGRRERYFGPTTEFREKSGYKPNVKLEYIDDDGHLLNAKEAFRYLSHKFHGKGPGKNKIEKRLKKSEQDALMKKMSSTDTPLGTLNMLQAKQKELQSSYIVLSGSKTTHATSISKLK